MSRISRAGLGLLLGAASWLQGSVSFGASEWVNPLVRRLSDPFIVAEARRCHAANPRLCRPDIIVSRVSIANGYLGSDGFIRIPLRVKVKNIGAANANKLKVSFEGRNQGALNLWSIPLEIVFGDPAPLGAMTTDALPVAGEASIAANLLFRKSWAGVAIDIRATADSCVGEPALQPVCRARESNEGNNDSAFLPLALPQL